MGTDLEELKTELQKNYMRLTQKMVIEAIEKGLTKQIIISMRAGQISDIRENNIIAGMSSIDLMLNG